MNEEKQRNNERWRNSGNLYGARDPPTWLLPGPSMGQEVAPTRIVSWGQLSRSPLGLRV